MKIRSEVKPFKILKRLVSDQTFTVGGLVNGIVMTDYGNAVKGQMNVGLKAVGTEINGLPERRQGVLRRNFIRSPVLNYIAYSHFQSLVFFSAVLYGILYHNI